MARIKINFSAKEKDREDRDSNRNCKWDAKQSIGKDRQINRYKGQIEFSKRLKPSGPIRRSCFYVFGISHQDKISRHLHQDNKSKIQEPQQDNIHFRGNAVDHDHIGGKGGDDRQDVPANHIDVGPHLSGKSHLLTHLVYQRSG